jgi:hypothetical protein
LGIISTSFLPRFIEIVSAVLRKLKMYENAPPPSPLKKRKSKFKKTCIPS